MKTPTKKYLISIVGPTAIGKTALAIGLAKYFNTEIISADSRQFFKEMAIGTAVPEPEELAAAPHHFIQHKSILEPYNVGDFEKEAIAKLNTLFKKHQIVIMVGGSGLYVDAVVKGLDSFPEIDPKIRENLNTILAQEGITPLQEKLKELDPAYATKVDLENPHRLIRALEVCIGSKKTYSSFLQQEKPKRDFTTISIGITADRPIIYDRINKRVDIMQEKGLLQEVRALKQHQHVNALQTVGYKEIFKYLDKQCSLDFALEEIKKNTRRFAKRQLTWFKRNPNTHWIDYKQDLQKTINHIKQHLE